MSSGNVRKGMTQAKFNEENVNIVYGEIVILSIIVGLYFQSWYYIYQDNIIFLTDSIILLKIVIKTCLARHTLTFQ